MHFRYPAAFVCIVVACATLASCGSKKLKPITLGKLADKTTDHNQQWYHITNAGMGEKTGRYLTFTMKAGDQYHVVFDLGSADVEVAGIDTWDAFCAGVRVSALSGCPCEPPFVLVTRSEPGSSTPTSTD